MVENVEPRPDFVMVPEPRTSTEVGLLNFRREFGELNSIFCEALPGVVNVVFCERVRVAMTIRRLTV